MKKILISWIITTSLLFSASPHVHDLGEARIIITNDIVDIHVTLPAINAIGFEHAPQTTAEKNQADLFFNQINAKPILNFTSQSFFKLWSSKLSLKLLKSEARFITPPTDNHHHHTTTHQDIVITQQFKILDSKNSVLFNARFLEILKETVQLNVTIIDQNHQHYVEINDSNKRYNLYKGT